MNFIQGRFDVLPPPITVLRLPTVKDAFTNASIPTLNYGDTHDLLTGLNYESFIGFDLSGLPEQEFIYSKLVLTLPRAAKTSEIPLRSINYPRISLGRKSITHANSRGYITFTPWCLLAPRWKWIYRFTRRGVCSKK